MPLDTERPNAFFAFPDDYLEDSKLDNLTEVEMVKILQGQDNSQKIPLLKSLIYRTSNGEHFPKILMSLMNCLTNENKLVKKLSMMCWENVDRYDAQGKLISEAILICNALKTNLEHPNEYIRGAALRCVSKLLDIELLDPVLPTIIINLDHHHVYVRRHALMCLKHIASHSPELNQYVSHLVEKVFRIASTEYNQNVRYHALLTLTALSLDHAIEFFDTISNSLHLQSGPFLDAILLIISASHRTHHRIVPNFIASLTLLLHKIAPGINSYAPSSAQSINNPTATTGASTAITAPPTAPSITFNTGLDIHIIFSVARTLLMIATQDHSIKLGLKVLIVLLKSAQDADLNLIIINSLTLLTQQSSYISLLAPFITDILSVLPQSDGQIKENILDLALILCSHSNVDSIVSILRREYINVQESIPTRTMDLHRADQLGSQAIDVADITLRHQVAGSAEQQYHHDLFRTLHLLAIRHPTVLPTIAPLISLSIADPNPLTSLNAMRLIREILLVNKSLRKGMLGRLCEKFYQIRTPEILRGVVWILGEFAGTDVIVDPNQITNQPFVPTPAPANSDKNDIHTLYQIGTFLVHALGLESFIPQQQLQEYNERMALAKANAQASGREFDVREYHQSTQVHSTAMVSQPRLLIYNGDMHFASVYTTALTKILIKIYNFHAVINVAHTAALPQHNRPYQQLHSSIVLILTRVLKFAPKVPLVELPHALPNTPAVSIHHTLAEERNGDITAIDTLTEDELVFYPETSFLGIGSDCYERMALNLKVCLYPADFGYIVTPAAAAATGGVPETIFSTSLHALQLALRHEHQNNLQMKELVGYNLNSNSSLMGGQVASHSVNLSTSSAGFAGPSVPQEKSTALKWGARKGPTGSNDNNDDGDNNGDKTSFLTLAKSQFGLSFVSATQLDPFNPFNPFDPLDIAPNNNTGNANNNAGAATVSTNPTGLKITSAFKPRAASLHAPIPIRLLRKNLEDGTSQPRPTALTFQEDTAAAITGSKSGNIYQPVPPTPVTPNLATSPLVISNNGLTATAYMEAKAKSREIRGGSVYSGQLPPPSIHPLSGLSDLIYAEAKLIIQMYDVILDVTVFNLSNSTLQNVTLEIQTSTDLALTAPIPSFSLAPRGTLLTTPSSDGSGTITENPDQNLTSLRFNINSTETGLIYGNISCDTGASGSIKNIIAIQPVVIDISQYLSPSACLATDYRSMWAEFEWENKVLVSTNMDDPVEFIRFVTTLTNMHCLSPLDAFIQQIKPGPDGKPQMPEFVAANLYGVSSFGEQALLNISVECINNRLSGCMRVRAKTRGVARSLGDLIKNKQRL